MLKFALGRHYSAKVPLFRDEETGNEYQIAVNLLNNLIYISCLMDGVTFNEQAEPLSRVIYQEEPSKTG